MLDREVAIKSTPDHAHQLLSEVRALSQRPSRFIVEIYDVMLDDNGNLSSIILEYLEGAGFESIDLKGDENRQRALGLLYQMAQGLADLHAVNLVHRDVKPENAVCTAGGRLKLVDFGLSSPGTGAETLNAQGTFGYAAPELFGPKPVPISFAMDVYSFAIVCWHKLVGKRPKVGSIGFPESAYFPLKSIGTKISLPPNLVDIIDRCLSWSPSDRPKMKDVAEALLAELTFGKHTACVLTAGQPPQALTTETGKVSSLKTAFGSLDIGYDGYKFSVRKVTGDVYVNNARAREDQELPPGCLLTFGAQSMGSQRDFIPFRQSAPEIVF